MAEDQNREEHEHISTALEVERIDNNLYRSRSLWLPVRSRGVFGGQVISQALVSATKCVGSAYGLHSMHGYFLLSASPAIPIIYFVERLREGRSYTTRSVKAVQNSKVVFVLLCSFHKPEPWQPRNFAPMPAKVPSPEACKLEEDVFSKLLEDNDLPEKVKSTLESFIHERSRSPVAIKTAGEHKGGELGTTYMFWMRAKNIPKYDAAFQKCILSYISDFYFIGVGARELGLKRFSRGPKAVGMTSSLDHSIYFYNDDFDCGDWLLYVVNSPAGGSGRGIVHGRLYTRTGNLVAVTTQEGVVRADIREPSETASTAPGAKL